MAKANDKMSPGRRQYLDLKQQYPDAMLLFRLGDFYETFDDDARDMARILDIALTARDVGGGKKSALAGIPYHALDSYLARLVKAGLKVAIAEQVSDPATTKGIVKREVVRVVTPGTVTDSHLLSADRNNYLLAISEQDDIYGFACVELTTSQFFVFQTDAARVLDEIELLNPAEILVTDGSHVQEMLTSTRFLLRETADVPRDFAEATSHLTRHFGATSLEPFGCADLQQAVLSASTLLKFLTHTQQGKLPQITELRTVDVSELMRMDRHVVKDLELFESQGGANGKTLFDCINYTTSPLGSRLLRRWLANPLKQIDDIQARLTATGELLSARDNLQALIAMLKSIGDLERITNRLRMGSATPRDLLTLADSLQLMPSLQECAAACGAELASLVRDIEPLDEFIQLVRMAIAEEANALTGDGSAIKLSYNAELDELRTLATDARKALVQLEQGERERTGIKSLKFGYNKVFGYYIEISNANRVPVPERFDRRQTLANAERYTTDELKQLENKILTARERVAELERTIFEETCARLARFTGEIIRQSEIVAKLDVLCSYATCAKSLLWTQPTVSLSEKLTVKNARHPIVESVLGGGHVVPNDITMDAGAEQVLIITGPNMSGKSTFIRTVAIVVLLAQIGSYVPADAADIGIVDAIFTRTGLSDDISGGRSTFMTEMVETAAILSRATARSLVVLDEIGRGTSTYDGLAVAQAVVEYIHNHPALGCRTLFATHYHEVAQLEQQLPRVVNYHIEILEQEQKIYFLHKIVRGSADRSYGVYVAKLAGIPDGVIRRARQLLAQFERDSTAAPAPLQGTMSLTLDSMEAAAPRSAAREVAETIRDLDINQLTPLEALRQLSELQQKLSDEI